jgi:hypothetical protein
LAKSRLSFSKEAFWLKALANSFFMNTESMYSNQCMLNLVRLFNLFAFYHSVLFHVRMFMLLSCLCLCVSMTSFVQDNHISFARAVNQITVILALHVSPGSCVDA